MAKATEATTFKRGIFGNGSFSGLAQFGNQDFKDLDFVWDLGLFISRLAEQFRLYEEIRNKLIRKYTTTWVNPKTKEEETGIRIGSVEEKNFMNEIEALNNKEITIDLPLPVLKKSMLDGKVNATNLSKAIPFLDLRK